MGWWWSSGNKSGDAKEDAQKKDSQPKAGKDAKTFDPARLPPVEKLPPQLQKIVDESDKDESFFDDIVGGR
jgi:mitochondrial fission process protein 1